MKDHTSIIIPSYNCSPYIDDAIQSILSQEATNIEIIVVDDGSSDSSAEIAEKYAPIVKVVRQKNQGPAAARNRGVRESKGEFIAFLDGDDVWLPNKLGPQLEFLKNNQNIDIIYGGFERWSADSKGNYPAVENFVNTKVENSFDPDLSGWIYHKLLLDNYIHIITAVIRRSLFDKVGGFDETLRTGEDYDFWLKASQHTKAYKLARPIALYRSNPNSTTRIPRTANNELDVLLHALHKYGRISQDGNSISDEDLKKRLSRLNFRHGYLHFWHGSSCVAEKAFREALRQTKDRKVKLFAYLLIAKARCLLSLNNSKQAVT
ncbi:glycosyltransferase [Pseudomonadota bacterium]